MRQASRERGGDEELAKRLRERRVEIEQATLLRVRAVSALPRGGGPEYAEGLRDAASVAVGFGLDAIERGDGSGPAIPDALLSQARLAARNGVGLDAVLRRYLAGHTLLDDFMIEEAQRTGRPDPAELKRLLRSQAAILDRLLVAVSEAYTEEVDRRLGGSEQRRTERIERLLAGEPLDVGDLGYDLDACHLGVIAVGRDAAGTVRDLATTLDRRLLLIDRNEDAVWAWLGGKSRPQAEALQAALSSPRPGHVALALGEPAEGLSGWRLTHRQARAAQLVCMRTGAAVARYGEVALLSSALQDDLLSLSLRRLYIAPLSVERDGGKISRETLRAYFAADQNLTSAAAALGVNRNTVANRLRGIEERIGRRLSSCDTEFKLALRLDELFAGRASGFDDTP